MPIYKDVLIRCIWMENVRLKVGVDSTSNANKRQTGHANTSLRLLLLFLQWGLLNFLFIFLLACYLRVLFFKMLQMELVTAEIAFEFVFRLKHGVFLVGLQ